jgi:hypothetical protein
MICVDGFTQIKPSGRYVAEIELDEHVTHLIKRGAQKQLVFLFSLMGESIHHGTIDTERLNAYKQLDSLKQVVEDILVGAGWEVHIVDSLKRTEAADYIHAAGYGLQVHEVPFTAECNIELRLDELCSESGNIRPKEETLALLKGRVGLDAFDLRELSEEDMDYVLAIMRQEERDLEYLHDVNVTGQELTTGARSFRWFRDEEEAEDEAMVYLTDDDGLWKGAVAAGSTTVSLEEWAKGALRIDGWAHILGGYDGMGRVAQLKDGAWFPYVRSD